MEMTTRRRQNQKSSEATTKMERARKKPRFYQCRGKLRQLYDDDEFDEFKDCVQTELFGHYEETIENTKIHVYIAKDFCKKIRRRLEKDDFSKIKKYVMYLLENGLCVEAPMVELANHSLISLFGRHAYLWEEILDFCFENGYNLNKEDQNEKSFLNYVLSFGNKSIFNKFREKIKQRLRFPNMLDFYLFSFNFDKHYNTPLHIACFYHGVLCSRADDSKERHDYRLEMIHYLTEKICHTPNASFQKHYDCFFSSYNCTIMDDPHIEQVIDVFINSVQGAFFVKKTGTKTVKEVLNSLRILMKKKKVLIFYYLVRYVRNVYKNNARDCDIWKELNDYFIERRNELLYNVVDPDERSSIKTNVQLYNIVERDFTRMYRKDFNEMIASYYIRKIYEYRITGLNQLEYIKDYIIFTLGMDIFKVIESFLTFQNTERKLFF